MRCQAIGDVLALAMPRRPGVCDPRGGATLNLQRRNLTKGQAAMALAMIYPEPEKGGRGNKGSRDGKVSANRFGFALAARHTNGPRSSRPYSMTESLFLRNHLV